MRNEDVAIKKPAVQKVLAEDWVFIKLYTNKGSKEHKAAVKKLRNEYKGAANPWYVFLTPDLRQIKRFGGQLTLDGFLKDLAAAKAESDRTAKAK